MGIYKLDELDFPTGANSVSSMSLSGHTNYYINIAHNLVYKFQSVKEIVLISIRGI